MTCLQQTESTRGDAWIRTRKASGRPAPLWQPVHTSSRPRTASGHVRCPLFALRVYTAESARDGAGAMMGIDWPGLRGCLWRPLHLARSCRSGALTRVLHGKQNRLPVRSYLCRCVEHIPLSTGPSWQPTSSSSVTFSAQASIWKRRECSSSLMCWFGSA